MSMMMNIVATRKQQKAEFDGVDSSSLLRNARLRTLTAAEMIPPIAWPWHKDPIYEGGNWPARPANPP